MTGDDVKKNLEDRPRQLQEKKSVAEEKKRKREWGLGKALTYTDACPEILAWGYWCRYSS